MRKLICLAAALALLQTVVLAAAEEKSAFANATIDLGIVVTDINKAAKFYTEAVGFKEVKGFGVPGPFAADAGLTESKPLEIRVFVLGDGPGATKIKLMQVEGTKPRKSDNEYIHSQTGFRYLTIFVNDTTAAVDRLKNAGVKPIAKTPLQIPEEIAPNTFLTIVRDPDGNFVELVGPKK
ncbi:MAG: bleomycin resistance protein [Gemmataceae bacterium]|nr:bleomycin resistance protein [Gemmataceae bacterium]